MVDLTLSRWLPWLTSLSLARQHHLAGTTATPDTLTPGFGSVGPLYCHRERPMQLQLRPTSVDSDSGVGVASVFASLVLVDTFLPIL